MFPCTDSDCNDSNLISRLQFKIISCTDIDIITEQLAYNKEELLQDCTSNSFILKIDVREKKFNNQRLSSKHIYYNSSEILKSIVLLI